MYETLLSFTHTVYILKLLIFLQHWAERETRYAAPATGTKETEIHLQSGFMQPELPSREFWDQR